MYLSESNQDGDLDGCSQSSLLPKFFSQVSESVSLPVRVVRQSSHRTTRCTSGPSELYIRLLWSGLLLMEGHRNVTVAATQMACSADPQKNIANAEKLVRQCAAKGAQVILLQELFQGPYFPQQQVGEKLSLAQSASVAGNACLAHFSKLAAELRVVLPISFYELGGNARFNSVIVFDADGSDLGIYRKSHIPDGPGVCRSPHSIFTSKRFSPSTRPHRLLGEVLL